MTTEELKFKYSEGIPRWMIDRQMTPEQIDEAMRLRRSAFPSTIPTRTWRSEFGESFAVPAEIQALVDAGKIKDASWHNDTAPCFEVGSGSAMLWVDHPDPSRREIDSYKRFTLICDTNEDSTFVLLETDNLAEMLAFMEAYQ